ncbi:MAG: hypothetical protein LVS60_06235 [Nodosilinea sp. LVE1205-7]
MLLLDEPLSALDALVRQQLREEIRRIQKTLQITTLFVTHDQAEAMAIADRVAVMRQGRIDQIATPWNSTKPPPPVSVPPLWATATPWSCPCAMVASALARYWTWLHRS